MSYFPAHMDSTEIKIINRVISAALQAGLTISVADGEEWALRASTDRAAIQRETNATDITEYLFRRNGEKVGGVIFIHGNGVDVIHDWSDNDATDAIVRPAVDYAESLW